MRLAIILLICYSFSADLLAQSNVRPHCGSPTFDKTLAVMLRFTVPTMSVDTLHKYHSKYTLLDARELQEYNVSHLVGATHIGYDFFDIKKVNNINKNTPIVVYCSVGYRSEKIGEKLQAAGYTNVKNLYGSIFEWVNKGYEIVDNKGQRTQKLHTYSYLWSKWVSNKKIEKVY